MPIAEKIKHHIENAWVDGYPCLVATTGKDGPNISPKGSMIVFDDQHLAYWERSKREQEHVGADTGIGVLVKIDRATDIQGNSII